METSVLLATLVGPMMLVLGLFVTFNPARIRRIGREFLDSEALIFLSGVITLPVGLAIVVTHNVWAADWRGLITLIGWIAIFAAQTLWVTTIARPTGSVMTPDRKISASLSRNSRPIRRMRAGFYTKAR